jgi:hypothetical protein
MVGLWLPEEARSEEGQHFGEESSPADRHRALWSLSFWSLFALMASMAVHGFIKKYLKASLIIGGGFFLAGVIGDLLVLQGGLSWHLLLDGIAKGLLAFIIALLAGLPFVYFRIRAEMESGPRRATGYVR